MESCTVIKIVFLALALFCSTPSVAQTPSAEASTAARRPDFLKPCGASIPEPTALCGSYVVFENRAARRGRKIALNMIVLPARNAKHAPDPVFFLAGGPGQSATELAGYFVDLMAQVWNERDLVILDERGTGKSNPLACDLYGAGAGLRDIYGEMFPPAKVRACRERLERIADLRQYTTRVAVEDLDEVRRALGYEMINLYGGSYGNKLALAYLRRHGPHVRTITAAGMVPPGFKLPLPFAKGVQYVMGRVIEDCAADAVCRATCPNLKRELTEVIARLEKEPATVELLDPATKLPVRFRLKRGIFAERLRQLLYNPEYVSVIPLVIHRAYLGDYATFVRASFLLARSFYQGSSIGMYFSATCSETVPLISEREIRRETASTFLGDYRTRVHVNACREWPRGVVSPGFEQAVSSDVPVLILSNEADPAAPYWFGAEALRHLPNGRQLIIRRIGHDYFSPCLNNIVAEFISKGSARVLDTSCLDKVEPQTFVTELPAELPH